MGWSPLPWLVFGLVGVISAAGLAIFTWWQNHYLPVFAQPVAMTGD
jgi:hypothetical protein